MNWADALPDLADWPVCALFVWLMIALVRFHGSDTYQRRAIAGVCFGWIALKVAAGLNLPLTDRWLMMIFANVGTVFLIDAVRAKE